LRKRATTEDGTDEDGGDIALLDELDPTIMDPDLKTTDVEQAKMTS